MSDAQPVADVTVRAVTDDNIELGRSTTDKNGIAIFSRSQLFPENSRTPAFSSQTLRTAPQCALQGPVTGMRQEVRRLDLRQSTVP